LKGVGAAYVAASLGASSACVAHDHSGKAVRTVTVNSVAAFEAELRAHTGGEVIRLAPGNYAGLGVERPKGDGVLEITSENIHHPAVLSGVTVSNSNRVEFSNLAISAPLGPNPYPNRVMGSSQITFSHIKFVGVTSALPADNNTGVNITGSTDIIIRNCSFEHLQNGIIESSNSRVRISGNAFEGLGGDGIDNAGSSNVIIDNNYFKNFENGNGIHADAIQFWTTGTTKSVENIDIFDNTVVRGDGSASQGIFVTDQVGNLTYDNVTILGNVVIGGMYNGITLEHGVNATIAGNTVVGIGDMQSWIRIEDSKKLLLENNQSQDIIFVGQADDQVTARGNGMPIHISSASAAFYSNIMPLPPATETSAVSKSLVGSAERTLVLTGHGDISVTANGLGDRIIANAGDATHISGAGDDTFTEGAGTDTFVFGIGCGHDTITNFGANGLHDVIDLSAFLAAGLKPTVRAKGNGAVVILGSPGDTITLPNLDPSALHWTTRGLTL
jgi:hypothetical protein